MAQDRSQVQEQATIGTQSRSPDDIFWRARWTVDKYAAGVADVMAGRVRPTETLSGQGNLLMNGGADIIWRRLTKRNPSTALSTATAAFSTKSAIAVGNSTATSTASQTNIQGGSKFRKVMDAGYPTHTTGTSTAARSAAFRMTASSSQANFAWQEFGIFNSTSTSAGAFRMLNRKVQSLGTKTSAATWQFTVTLTIS